VQAVTVVPFLLGAVVLGILAAVAQLEVLFSVAMFACYLAGGLPAVLLANGVFRRGSAPTE
jgi:hypothetical protein